MKDLIDYDHNVLFITLDSCRWDTYQKAKTPNLDKIGIAQGAQTPASYTYPAHHSFFIGHLPSTGKDEDFNSRRGAYLWRLNRATKNNIKAGVRLGGGSILEGYRKKGYKIKGFGGTSFFARESSALRMYFKRNEFIYCGPFKNCYERTSTKSIPLFNLSNIVSFCESSENWFVFINEPATHMPYNIERMNSDEKNVLKSMEPYFGGYRKSPSHLNYKLGKLLHNVQVRTLEIIDNQIGRLLDQISGDKPILIVVCGDHGELFGEKGKWGHLQNEKEVLTVPLLINTKYKGR